MKNDVKALIEKLGTEHNRLTNMTAEVYGLCNELEAGCKDNGQNVLYQVLIQLDDVTEQIAASRDDLSEAIKTLQKILPDIQVLLETKNNTKDILENNESKSKQ